MFLSESFITGARKETKTMAWHKTLLLQSHRAPKSWDCSMKCLPLQYWEPWTSNIMAVSLRWAHSLSTKSPTSYPNPRIWVVFPGFVEWLSNWTGIKSQHLFYNHVFFLCNPKKQHQINCLFVIFWKHFVLFKLFAHQFLMVFIHLYILNSF